MQACGNGHDSIVRVLAALPAASISEAVVMDQRRSCWRVNTDTLFSCEHLNGLVRGLDRRQCKRK